MSDGQRFTPDDLSKDAERLAGWIKAQEARVKAFADALASGKIERDDLTEDPALKNSVGLSQRLTDIQTLTQRISADYTAFDKTAYELTGGLQTDDLDVLKKLDDGAKKAEDWDKTDPPTKPEYSDGYNRRIEFLTRKGGAAAQLGNLYALRRRLTEQAYAARQAQQNHTEALQKHEEAFKQADAAAKKRYDDSTAGFKRTHRYLWAGIGGAVAIAALLVLLVLLSADNRSNDLATQVAVAQAAITEQATQLQGVPQQATIEALTSQLAQIESAITAQETQIQEMPQQEAIEALTGQLAQIEAAIAEQETQLQEMPQQEAIEALTNQLAQVEVAITAQAAQLQGVQVLLTPTNTPPSTNTPSPTDTPTATLEPPTPIPTATTGFVVRIPQIGFNIRTSPNVPTDSESNVYTPPTPATVDGQTPDPNVAPARTYRDEPLIVLGHFSDGDSPEWLCFQGEGRPYWVAYDVRNANDISVTVTRANDTATPPIPLTPQKIVAEIPLVDQACNPTQ